MIIWRVDDAAQRRRLDLLKIERRIKFALDILYHHKIDYLEFEHLVSLNYSLGTLNTMAFFVRLNPSKIMSIILLCLLACIVWCCIHYSCFMFINPFERLKNFKKLIRRSLGFFSLLLRLDRLDPKLKSKEYDLLQTFLKLRLRYLRLKLAFMALILLNNGFQNLKHINKDFPKCSNDLMVSIAILLFSLYRRSGLHKFDIKN